MQFENIALSLKTALYEIPFSLSFSIFSKKWYHLIKTKQDAEADPEMDFDNQGSTDKVKQMAKSAMNRRK